MAAIIWLDFVVVVVIGTRQAFALRGLPCPPRLEWL
jgi:hypothetical protein